MTDEAKAKSTPAQPQKQVQQNRSSAAEEAAVAAQQKSMKLLIYWAFSTVLIVFAAITAYIALWARPLGASMTDVMMMGFPIWGITILAAVILIGGYYFLMGRKSA